MTIPRGHVRGIKAAAEYCGISDRATFLGWCREFNLRPRILRGQAYFKLAELDKFMSPESNAPGAEEEFWRHATTAASA